MLQYNMQPLLDPLRRLKQINLRLPGRFSTGESVLIGPSGFLAALALTVLLFSPALAIILPESPQLESNSYDGGTIRVTTQAASGVTNTSATLNGFLASLGPYIQVNVSFEYILNNGESNVTMQTAPTTLTAPGPFSASVSGLSSYSPYQFRAVASSLVQGEQKVIGGYLPFHTLLDTLATPVVLSNSLVTNISTGTAVLNGYISSMASYSEVKVWFNWGTSAGFGNTTGEQVLHEPGPFSIKISGLQPETIYYYCAGALPSVAGIDTVYSTTDTFTTLASGNLVVNTWEGTDVTTSSATIAGNLESMGAYTSANVWFEWGTTGAYGHVTPMQTIYQTGIYTYRLEGLTEGTTYHFRPLAIPGSLGWVTARGHDKEFTTTSLPGIVVNTEPANSITANSAVLSGYITSLGPSGTISAWFDYGTDSSFGSSTQRQTLVKPGNFTYVVSGLSPGTTYYFRVEASADARSASGQYSTFTTAAASVLSISTRDASLITLSSALLHAYINSIGSAPSTKAWFNFGTGPEYGMSTPILTFNAAGDVSAQTSGLIADTTYYFQAVAQTPDGNKAYGKQATFKTASIPKAAVSTYPATGVTDSSATLNGKLDNLGNASSLQAWFEYGTTAEFGNVTIVRTFASTIPFSSAIPVLPGTTYYYRAVALNPVTGGGSVSGATISFVTATLPSPPVVSPVTSPYDWFIYCQQFISLEIASILKSWNINFGK